MPIAQFSVVVRTLAKIARISRSTSTMMTVTTKDDVDDDESEWEHISYSDGEYRIQLESRKVTISSALS